MGGLIKDKAIVMIGRANKKIDYFSPRKTGPCLDILTRKCTAFKFVILCSVFFSVFLLSVLALRSYYRVINVQ